MRDNQHCPFLSTIFGASNKKAKDGDVITYDDYNVVTVKVSEIIHLIAVDVHVARNLARQLTDAQAYPLFGLNPEVPIAVKTKKNFKYYTITTDVLRLGDMNATVCFEKSEPTIEAAAKRFFAEGYPVRKAPVF